METSTTVRARFIVTSVTKYAGLIGASVFLSPVNPQWQETSENLAFWEATPNGEIKLQITNPEAARQFEPGKEFYIDFTEAVHAPPSISVASGV